MGSPEFSESSGKLLETMLAAQKLVRDNMRTYLETMNVPTREDIARLGELVVGLEEKIDQVADHSRRSRKPFAPASLVPLGLPGPTGPIARSEPGHQAPGSVGSPSGSTRSTARAKARHPGRKIVGSPSGSAVAAQSAAEGAPASLRRAPPASPPSAAAAGNARQAGGAPSHDDQAGDVAVEDAR